MPTVRVNDCDLHYEEAGDGPPVLFIHGLWCSGRFFRDQLPAFAERFRTVVLDLRGHGRSEHTRSGHTVAQYARDVRAFCEALGLEDVVVLGWSMGSLVIWDYVEQYGTDRLRAMVDVDQSPSDYRWPDWPYGMLDLAALHHLHAGVQTDFPATAGQMVPLVFKDPPPPDVAAWVVAEVTRLPPGIAAAILFEQTVVDYRETLPKVTVPALLCFGRSEQLVPVAAAEWMVERMPSAELVVFEDSDHCPFLEEAGRFTEVVGDWIAALP
jgi:pimeloyl-ACP methyl ester carboxylesterase